MYTWERLMKRIKIRKGFLNQEGKNDPGLKMHLDRLNKRFIFIFGTVKLIFQMYKCKSHTPCRVTFLWWSTRGTKWSYSVGLGENEKQTSKQTKNS